MATYLQEMLGQKLTAVVVDIKDPKEVGRWARGVHAPRPETERHLRSAFQIAMLLAQVESPETVRAWFMGMNPQLDDRAPALMVVKEPASVMQAARAFLAGG
jgi:hypothetical protein